MLFSLRRGSIEGAIKLKIIPESIAGLLQKALDTAPNVDKVDLDIKLYDNTGVEINAVDKMKHALITALLTWQGK